AGEAFDKTAKLLGLGYPGGPQLAKLAEHGAPSGKNAFVFPRPMLSQLEKTGDLDFSFSGLKTAVVLACRQRESLGQLDDKARADIAAEFQRAVVDVLVAKSIAALDANSLDTLVVAGGVGANRALRDALGNAASLSDFRVYYPEIALCTDNGAMIAFAAAQRLSGKRSGRKPGDGAYTFTVRPRWDLARTT
ncbi:MAG: tRNA (adenosine(37)-N6)-threonylcarbamoyltransferase complex transferase subunit TsaD, partial [Betaproteobacteria bacterium]|nr:tRNA (adenosine(37)-N6)-threonylcarbamoyltransferase complex transferase subunit TsaD [Betaproteobacteria bacterium]